MAGAGLREDTVSLDDVGRKFGVDKSSTHANILVAYEFHLAPLRRPGVSLLEFGHDDGSSLAMWEDYFLNPLIVGVYPERCVRQFATSRVSVEVSGEDDAMLPRSLIEKRAF